MLWCFELSVSERSVKASASGECEALSASVCEREFVVAVCCGSLQVWRPMWRQVKARVKARVED